MANESSNLLDGSARSQKKNGTLHGTLTTDNTDSFVKAETTGQKMFLVFLAFLILGLIGLSIAVIYDVNPDTREKSLIKTFDNRADESLKILNSMYHRKHNMQSGCESTLLLMRHCERNPDGVIHRDGNSYCSWLGRERAYFLPSLFDPNNPQTRRWPVPSKVFALTEARGSWKKPNNDKRQNYREIETVMPLANKFNLTIDVYSFNSQELANDYFQLLQKGKLCGKVTVVSWKHELIPDLALALACGPNEGCPHDYPEESFDEVWQIKFVLDPEGKARISPNPMNLPVKTRGPATIFEPSNTDLPTNALDDDDDDDDNVGEGSGERRVLRKKHSKAPKASKKKWVVYGTKTNQNFDPLQFSLQSGDYPPGGSPTGGKWADEM